MATETLRPNAAGDECNIPSQSGAACPNHWQNVDEETPDGTATRVRTALSSWTRDLYNIADHSAGSGTINFIKVYARAKSWVAGSSLKIAIKTGGTAYETSAIAITTAWATYSNQWTTNPNTGVAWTWDEIGALQVGISLVQSGGDTSCTQVYVEVDYTPGETPKASSDSGSGVDAVVSLQTPAAKLSSDAGSGVEGTPLSAATLAGSESGSGIEALIARLLATVEIGYSAEASVVGGEGEFRALFASELGEGVDLLTAKIEKPAKGGGMKLWT